MGARAADGRAAAAKHVSCALADYAYSLFALQRFEEAKALSRQTMPVARRVLGESNDLTLIMRMNYARALYKDDDATLDDLREAVATLEDSERIARRVLGGAYPLTTGIEGALQNARAALGARETPSGVATRTRAARARARPSGEE